MPSVFETLPGWDEHQVNWPYPDGIDGDGGGDDDDEDDGGDSDGGSDGDCDDGNGCRLRW